MLESRPRFSPTDVLWLKSISKRDVRNSFNNVLHGILVPLNPLKAIEVELCSRIVEKRGCRLEKCRWTGFTLVVRLGVTVAVEVVRFRKDLAGSRIVRRMLAEMVRLSYQHRAFYCYVILSVWIFLLVAGNWRKFAILWHSHFSFFCFPHTSWLLCEFL